MRALRALGITGILVGVLLAGGLPTAQAGTYLGEFCWGGGNGGVGKFAVTDMGGGHFFLNGKFIKPGGIVNEVASGNAEVVGSQILLSLTTAGSNASDTWSSFARIVLDLTTLNGTAEIWGIDHSKTNPDPSNVQLFYDGVVALPFVPCP